MSSTWTSTKDALPTPDDGKRYLVTVDWGYNRPLQLAVVRFEGAVGNPKFGVWKLYEWPHRIQPAIAWMPAPDAYEPPAKEGAA